MGYTVTRDFPAPAEVVFSTATDLDRWARWLPSGVTVERAGSQELRVSWAGSAHRVRWETVPERMEVAARPLDQPWSATMRVVPGPAGSSTAELSVDGDAGVLRRAAEQALRHLDAEVSDNFNVS